MKSYRQVFSLRKDLSFLPAAQCFFINLINRDISDIRLPDNLNCTQLLAEIKHGEIIIERETFSAGNIISKVIQPEISLSLRQCTLFGFLIPAQAYPTADHSDEIRFTRRLKTDSPVSSLISYHINYCAQNLPLLTTRDSISYQHFLGSVIPEFISGIPVTDKHPPQSERAEYIWNYSRADPAHPDHTLKKNNIEIIKKDPILVRNINLNKTLISILKKGNQANIKNISHQHTFRNESRFSAEFRKRFGINPGKLMSYQGNTTSEFPRRLLHSLIHL